MSIVSELRREYRQRSLTENEVSQNPVVQFQLWFDEALKAEITEPNAFTLSTVNAEGYPSSRIVLLKGIGNEGFEFYTNYQSKKGQDIEQNSHVAMNFCWLDLERQIRIEGIAKKLDATANDTYFYSRPAGSQLGAVVSAQSQTLGSREALEEKYRELELYYTEHPVRRPEHWGGYLIKPTLIEFWQGRPSRLHDRLQYTLSADGSWNMVRLYP